jgi:hypothetical protein
VEKKKNKKNKEEKEKKKRTKKRARNFWNLKEGWTNEKKKKTHLNNVWFGLG